MEMSGLVPDRDRIIEVAMVVTDSELNTIAEAPVYVVHQPEEVLEAMDSWNKSTHGKSGLIDKVRVSTFTEAEVEKRLGVAERLARCIDDPRCPDQVIHSVADMIGFRTKMIAAGYEDGNDATRLRSDPIFKMAQDGLPSGRDLASQSTMCRLENLA